MSAATTAPCRCGTDQKLWRDEQSAGGYIRTVCKLCGKWIGNRNSRDSKPEKPEAKPEPAAKPAAGKPKPKESRKR